MATRVRCRVIGCGAARRHHGGVHTRRRPRVLLVSAASSFPMSCLPPSQGRLRAWCTNECMAMRCRLLPPLSEVGIHLTYPLVYCHLPRDDGTPSPYPHHADIRMTMAESHVGTVCPGTNAVLRLYTPFSASGAAGVRAVVRPLSFVYWSISFRNSKETFQSPRCNCSAECYGPFDDIATPAVSDPLRYVYTRCNFVCNVSSRPSSYIRRRRKEFEGSVRRTRRSSRADAFNSDTRHLCR
ncbi:hypothetical protein BDV95DRAFT_364061 [Massariosphaeria phaeospora]|uniref:Uncharacterized protein n=1 Tax=Massariosphaeria phaeospora TaxID=100035 RepID=A0A7C8IA01_9PLEO|nr:hypothetical protein BDV95DRAFT_364061 [Massariosphaeria phaeospora]